jgi:hypothetical protein
VGVRATHQEPRAQIGAVISDGAREGETRRLEALDALEAFLVRTDLCGSNPFSSARPPTPSKISPGAKGRTEKRNSFVVNPDMARHDIHL